MGKRWRSRLLSTLAVLAVPSLASCASGNASSGSGGVVSVRGELVYRERIALPPDAVASVEIRAFDADGDRVIGHWREELNGRQVPIAFELSVPRSVRHPAVVYELRGAIQQGARTLRGTDPLLIDLVDDGVNTATLPLRPWPQVAVGTALACGRERAIFDGRATAAVLVVGDRSFDLQPASAAAGARYQAAGDETTSIHETAGNAIITVAGRQLPPCRRIELPALPFEARGQEPGWNVRIQADRVQIETGYGAQRLSLPRFASEQLGRAARTRAADSEHRAVVVAEDRVCRDLATGMPHPYVVVVDLDGSSLSGCGGRPLDLLAGREWAVERLDEGGVLDRSQITLEFDVEGRVSGLASCNRFSAGFELTGEGLRIAQAASTMMACAEPLMQQEQQFLQILTAVERFDIDDTGALQLHGGGHSLLARETADADPVE